jgi:hypothetical protein
MNENHIGDIWLLVKEYAEKKALESLAERYVDLLADHGISDKVFKEAIGYDETLDDAIEYYLGQDADTEFEDDEESWDSHEEDE